MGIILLLIAICLFLLGRGLWKVNKVYRQFTAPFKEAARRSRQAAEDRNNKASGNKHKGYGDGRIIPPDYGEYVEYVEIKEYSKDVCSAPPAGRDGGKYSESQVSDAEWEDI